MTRVQSSSFGLFALVFISALILGCTVTDWRTLEQVSRAGIADRPEDITHWINLLNALHRLDRFEEASQTASDAIKRFPGDPAIVGQCVRAYRQAGMLQEACKIINTFPREKADGLMLAEMLFLRHVQGRQEDVNALFSQMEELFRGSNQDASRLLQEYKATFCGDDASASQQPHPRIVTEGDCSMEILETCGITIQSKINGAGPFSLVLDSGGLSRICLNRTHAATAKLKPTSQATSVSVVDASLLPMSIADSVKIGDIEMAHIPTVTYSPSKQSRSSGTLGTGLFASHRITFDLARQRFTVSPSSPDLKEDRRATVLDFWLIADKIVVMAEIKGYGNIACIVDTGAGKSMVSRRLATALSKTHTSTTKPIEFLVSVGQRSVDVTVVQDVEVIFAKTKCVFDGIGTLDFIDEQLTTELGIEVSMIIGFDVLGMFERFSIDHPKRQLVFVRKRAFPWPRGK